MLFAICHPAIANEAQIGLALRILCGFGIDATPCTKRKAGSQPWRKPKN
jgi:hypothetical protein